MLVASLCLVLGFVGFSPPTAQADEDYAVQVEITSLSTAALTLSDDEADDDESITIKGKLTNNFAEPMNWVAAEVWRSNNPITTPAPSPLQPPARPLTCWALGLATPIWASGCRSRWRTT